MMIEGLKGASLRMKKNRDVEIKKKQTIQNVNIKNQKLIFF